MLLHAGRNGTVMLFALLVTVSLCVMGPSVGPAPARPSQTKARERAVEAAAVRQAALDYIEGWYEGNYGRVEPVLHPEFVRRIAGVTVAGDDFFIGESRAEFLDGLRRGGDKATPVAERAISVSVLDLTRTMATARVESAYYVEYLSMVRRRDRWSVVNVLWENVPNDKVAVVPDPSRLAECAGSYRHPSGVVWEVLVEGDRIFLEPPSQPRIEVFADAGGNFFTKGYKSDVLFVRSESGKVTAMIKRQGYRDTRWTRIDER